MKREIKFRAWGFDGECYTCDFIMSNHGEVYHCEYGNLVASATGVVIEQFTGLLDRNGVEIYEGDVVRCVYDDSADGLTTLVGAVQWVDSQGEYIAGWETKDAFKVWTLNTNCKSDTIEIIGNIHENPDLIGGDNA